MPTLRNYLFTFSFFAAGCGLCAILQGCGVPAIPAAALLGAAISFTPAARSHQRVFWTGVFVGMGSREVLPDALGVLGASGLGALLYVTTGPYFNGIGGKMGAVAFVTSAAWLLLRVVT